MAAPARVSGQPLLFACDLDGTLLDYEAAPVPGVGEALAELIAAGVLFAVVTGRPLQSARRATAALGSEPLIYACYHGALVVEADGTLVTISRSRRALRGRSPSRPWPTASR